MTMTPSHRLGPRGSRLREHPLESGAPGIPRSNSYGAAVGKHNLLHDEKTQAEPFWIRAIRSPTKWLEDRCQALTGDRLADIVDATHDAVSAVFEHHVDGRILRTVGDRIFEEVSE